MGKGVRRGFLFCGICPIIQVSLQVVAKKWKNPCFKIFWLFNDIVRLNIRYIFSGIDISYLIIS